MFKAIKNKKIIAVNETGVFPCLVYDSIEQDDEHTVDDYIHDDGQFILKTSDEAKEQKAAEVRAERDRRIDAVRWRIERYQTQTAAGIPPTDTAEQYQAILMYIQALRDLPGQDGFPDNIVWPVIQEKEENTENVEEPTASDQTEETA